MMLTPELYHMVYKLTPEEKIQFCKDLLSEIYLDTYNTLDKLAHREAEIKTVLKLTKDETIKNIFSEDE